MNQLSPLDIASRIEALRRQRTLRRNIWLLALIVVTGGLACGMVWHWVVRVPNFITGEDGSATISERAASQVFRCDGAFVVIGLLAGLLIGVLSWRLLRHIGWLVSIVTAFAALLSGCCCWALGVMLGPNNFAERVSKAVAGDQVPIDFGLHSFAALLVWPLAAVLPILLYSTLNRDGEPVAETDDEMN